MENEILSTLSDIKTAVYVLIAVVVIGVVANWVRAGVSVRNLIKRQLDDLFTDEASDLHDSGKFDELLVHCEEHLKTKPNHSYALWYKAKAYYHKNDYRKSKKCFEKLAITDPGWDEAYVQPYLNRIEKLEGESG